MNRTRSRWYALAGVAGVAIAGGVIALATASDCDNGSNASGCTVGYTRVPLPPNPVPFLRWVEVSPVNVGGNASCTAGQEGCGYDGTGPVAVLGDSSCNAGWSGCGYVGAGPVSVDGDSSCSAGAGCGEVGAAGLAVGGDASCVASFGCGDFGAGPISVGGNASCTAESRGCGHAGTGPIATGDVSCRGTCGKTAEEPTYTFGVNVPRSGTPGIAVLGHASCNEPFDRTKATDPSAAVQHAETFECVSAAEAAA